MRATLKTFLLIGLVAATSMAMPETSSTTESITELEEDLDTDEDTAEEVHDDVHCEEVEKLKDFYCTTPHCKHFYSKHCYDIVDGVHPTCQKVRMCIEARVSQFHAKTEKHKDEPFKNGSDKLFLSVFPLFALTCLCLFNANL
jgi:hypothetical protein